jgi:GMP synthase-like glutamine amidotransferase
MKNLGLGLFIIMENLKVAILDLYNHVPNQGMRNIKSIIENHNSPFDIQLGYEVYDVRAKAEVPDYEDFDIYISTGGPGSPFDGEGQNWEKKYFQLIDKLWNYNAQNHERKKYVFFICHSFQMACRLFDIGNVCMRKSASFGVFPIHTTDAGKQDPFLQSLPEPFYGVDNRNWQVIELDYHKIEALGAKVLAYEKIRPHIPLERSLMAVRLSNEFFATQFHPEADPKGMIYYLNDETKKLEIFEHHGEEKYYDMVSHLNDPDKILLTQQTIIPTFLNQAIESTQNVLSE